MTDVGCAEIQALLGACEAAVGDDPAVAAHLHNCPRCNAFAADLARLDVLFAAEPVLPAPPDLAAVIVARVAARRAGDLAWARRRQRLALAVACAVALVAAGLGISGDEGGLLGWLWGLERAQEWELSLSLLARAEAALAAAAAALLTPLADAAPALDGLPWPSWAAVAVLGPVLALNVWLSRHRTPEVAT